MITVLVVSNWRLTLKLLLATVAGCWSSSPECKKRITSLWVSSHDNVSVICYQDRKYYATLKWIPNIFQRQDPHVPLSSTGTYSQKSHNQEVWPIKSNNLLAIFRWNSHLLSITNTVALQQYKFSSLVWKHCHLVN